MLALRARRWPGGWPLLAAVGVLLAYGAPVLLSGQATFLGFIRLDDTATWFNIIDHVMSHGRSVAALPNSTYQLQIQQPGPAYPLGAFMLPGVARALTGIDIAWVFQPYLACCGAAVALCVYALIAPLVPGPRLRALLAFLGAQPALLYGYSLWGGIKEMTAAFLLALGAALAAALMARRPASWRELLPLALAAGALIQTLGAGAAGWVAPALLFLVGVWLWREHGARRARGVAASGGWLVAITAVCVLPVWIVLADFLTNKGKLLNDSSRAAVGSHETRQPDPPAERVAARRHLADRRLPPDRAHRAERALDRPDADRGAVRAVPGRAPPQLRRALLRRGRPDRLRRDLFLRRHAVGDGQVARDLIARGAGGGADGRRHAVGSAASRRTARPCAAHRRRARDRGARRRRAVVERARLPRRDARAASAMVELQHIGKLVAGKGPTFMNDYEVYADRHFLREGAPVEPAEYRAVTLPLSDGAALTKSAWADLDSFPLSTLEPYRSIVTERSPAESRPPSIYQLVWQGRYYQLWQRPVHPATSILEHVPLGESNTLPYCGPAANARPDRSARSTPWRSLRARRCDASPAGRCATHARARRLSAPAPIVARGDQTLWPGSLVSRPHSAHVDAHDPGAGDRPYRVAAPRATNCGWAGASPAALK